jgi:hypothetical protein
MSEISPNNSLHQAALHSVAAVDGGFLMHKGLKNGFSSGLPTRPNATIRSPVAAATNHGRPAANTAIKHITF